MIAIKLGKVNSLLALSDFVDIKVIVCALFELTFGSYSKMFGKSNEVEDLCVKQSFSN